MDTPTPTATLRETAATLAADAAGLGGAFLPGGIRQTLERAAAFCVAAAEQMADLEERLQTEASTNAEILARLGELEAKGDAA